MSGTADFEARLRQAFAPIDPPEDLELRLEERFAGLLEMAQDELETWELSSMRDPRNWVRPVAAAAVGSAAAVGLVVVRTQRKRHKRRAASDNVLELAERTIRDLAHEAGKLLDDTQKKRK